MSKSSRLTKEEQRSREIKDTKKHSYSASGQARLALNLQTGPLCTVPPAISLLQDTKVASASSEQHPITAQPPG